MKLEDQIIVYKFGQDLIELQDVITHFRFVGAENKVKFLRGLVNLVVESRPVHTDIDAAITLSNLNPALTPHANLKKGGLTITVLLGLINLPDSETEKVLILLLSLFKIAYQRALKKEMHDGNKWWFQDLSDDTFVERIRSLSVIQIIIRRLFDLQGFEVGATLGTAISYPLNSYEKTIVERQLERHAYFTLYPGQALTIYRDTLATSAAVTVIINLDDLATETETIVNL